MILKNNKIVQKFIIIGKYFAILDRDIIMTKTFDNYEQIKDFVKNKYFARPTEIALIEGEIYDPGFCKDKILRDVKELCGFRIDLDKVIKETLDLDKINGP